MSGPRWSFVAALAATLSLTFAEACREAPAMGVIRDEFGPGARLGNGSIRAFARMDGEAPVALGVVMPGDVLASLPPERSDRHRCFDVDGDGRIEEEGECLPTHERVLPLPTAVSGRDDVPFKWMLFNWNPVGHAPPHIFGLPHFDIHFVMEPIENVFALMPGPCGPELLRCDQFEIARRPVPAGYVHPDFQSVDAAVPAMGNHLIDLTSHEFHGGTFDRTWIYGAYDGRVTFWEEMVTLDFVRGKPDRCYEIKTPSTYEVAGYYPTRACYAYDAERDEQRMSMEGFVYREAAARPAAGS